MALPKTFTLTTSRIIELMRSYLFYRTSVLVGANIHVAHACGAFASASRAHILRYIVLYASTVLLCSSLLFSITMGVIAPRFGVRIEAINVRPDMRHCLFGEDAALTRIKCEELHLTPGIHEEIARETEEISPASHYLAMAWGAEPLVDVVTLFG